MKTRQLSKLVVLLLTFISLSSCSKTRDLDSTLGLQNESVEILSEKDVELKAALIKDLSSFNSNYEQVIKNSSDVKLRSFWSKLGDVLVVSSADIVSAGAGAFAAKEVASIVGIATGGTGFIVTACSAAAIAGAGGSIATARSLRSSSIITPFIGNLSIDYPEKYKNLSVVGSSHNKYVAAIANGSLRSENSKDQIEKEILDNKEFSDLREEIDDIMYKNVGQNGDINMAIDELVIKGIVNEKIKLVYNLFFNIYNQSKNFENIEDIVNHYLYTISETDFLDETEKVALISSFSVASESPCLWSQQK